MKAKLLEVFRAKIERKLSIEPEIYSADLALLYLLEEFEKDLPEVDDYFHKAFRQVDPIDRDGVNYAIWNLVGLSELFWEAFDEVTNNKFLDTPVP